MEKRVEDKIKDRIYSFISEGVEKFPKEGVLKIHKQKGHDLKLSIQLSETSSKSPQTLQSTIAQCSLCPLAQARKKVVVSSTLTKKKFFILSEFPESEDENSPSPFLFSTKSSSGLIIKLLEKLNILPNCAFSFALKCVPEKGVPKNSFSTCAQNNLKQELQMVSPEVILCFGHKAMFALAQLDPSLLLTNISENSSSFVLNFENTQKKGFFLSSSRDLQSFPHWRSQVWRFVEHLKDNSH